MGERQPAKPTPAKFLMPEHIRRALFTVGWIVFLTGAGLAILVLSGALVGGVESTGKNIAVALFALAATAPVAGLLMLPYELHRRNLRKAELTRS